jgi:hypothetical protein
MEGGCYQLSRRTNHFAGSNNDSQEEPFLESQLVQQQFVT